MISLLISLILICLGVGVVFWLLTLLPIPQPFLNVIKFCIILICFLYILSLFVGNIHPFVFYR